MSTDRRQVPLGALVEIFDGPHATPPASEHGPVFLGIGNLVGGRVDLSDVKHISEDDYRKWTRRVTPRAGDLVFSYETRLGEAALIPEGLRCCLGRRMGLLRVRDNKVDGRYLLYAYLGPQFQSTLAANTIHGSTVDRIPLNRMAEFPITIASEKREQKAIASILGALDDKIELNRRMSETLEEMARALFIGAFAGSSSGTGVDAYSVDAGRLPPYWRLSRIGDEVAVVLGGTPSRKVPEFWGGRIPWINSGKVNEFRITTASEHITELGLAKSAAKLLPARTTVIAITGATLGKVSLTEMQTSANQSVVGVLGSSELPSEYLYFWIKENAEHLVARQTGGAQQHINKNDVSELPLLCPSESAMTEYVRGARPVFDRIRVCLLESEVLAQLRVALLPKLISGELRVPDAERLVSEVV